ncbi:MAG: carbamoyltransferase C-terminal domain-containing protein, partial [Bacteroidota bacterium]
RDHKWEKLFGFPRRAAESELEQKHCNLGLAIQQVTEEIVLLMAQEAQRLTGAKHLCLAGGVALNCVANGKLQNAGIFEEIYIQPAAGDAGGALGAALAAHHLYFEQERTTQQPDAMRGAYLGPEYADAEIAKTLKRFGAPAQHFAQFEDLCQEVADEVAKGSAIGWFQGAMEFGPRALGNRSILGDPRNPDMQLKLNLKIKYRESFRPFAPSVLAEDAEQFFELPAPSPYMLLVQPVQSSIRRELPSDYHELPIKEKLYTLRSEIPAITHIDFSARIQTVHEDTNPRYHGLLQAVKAKTGVGMLVNTSFNVRGEPIVCTPEDAYRCFMRTEMDILVVGNYLLRKTEQPEENQQTPAQEAFGLD